MNYLWGPGSYFELFVRAWQLFWIICEGLVAIVNYLWGPGSYFELFVRAWQLFWIISGGLAASVWGRSRQEDSIQSARIFLAASVWGRSRQEDSINSRNLQFFVLTFLYYKSKNYNCPTLKKVENFPKNLNNLTTADSKCHKSILFSWIKFHYWHSLPHCKPSVSTQQLALPTHPCPFHSSVMLSPKNTMSAIYMIPHVLKQLEQIWIHL